MKVRPPIRRILIILACAMMLGLAARAIPAFASDATTQPADDSKSAQISQWINQLADDDPDLRRTAAQSLMGLSADDLPTLRQCALKQSPLLPGQISALREIVTQVYLSGDNEPVTPAVGFLGLHWPPPNPQGMMQIGVIQPDDLNTDGLPVVERIPGFPAYRLLQPGDLITAVLNEPDIDVHDRSQFIQSVSQMKAGDELDLQIKRGGQNIEIPLKLAPRPLSLLGEPANYDAWLDERLTDARDFWNKSFSDLEPQSPQTSADTTQP